MKIRLSLTRIRYVDTFEEDAEIDLKAVKKEIAYIEGDPVNVRQKIDGYLKGMGP